MPNASVAAAATGLPELSQLTVAELAFIYETAAMAAIAISEVQNNPRCTRDAGAMLEQHSEALWNLAGKAADIMRAVRPRGTTELETCARTLLANAVHAGAWQDAYRAVALLRVGA